MKKCFICEKEIMNNKDSVCESCKEFFKWKYGNRFLRHLEKLKEYLSRDEKSIKFRRKK